MTQHDELDRLAIRAIIEAALPHPSREHKLPMKQGPCTRVLSSAFNTACKRSKFKMYEGKVQVRGVAGSARRRQRRQSEANKTSWRECATHHD
jgi:hypothetical protein